MIQIDLSRPEAKIDKIRGLTPQVILGGGPEQMWTPSLVRIDRHPTRKSRVSSFKSDDPVFKLYRAGEYEARSYLGSQRGTAFAIDFILTREGSDWDNLELEIIRVNFQLTFIVFETPIVVVPTVPVKWMFSRLNTNNPLFNGVAQQGQLTRFDRINALLEDD